MVYWRKQYATRDIQNLVRPSFDPLRRMLKISVRKRISQPKRKCFNYALNAVQWYRSIEDIANHYVRIPNRSSLCSKKVRRSGKTRYQAVVSVDIGALTLCER